MRGLLVDMKKGHPGQEEGLRTCWQTLLKMCGNVYNSPGGCCAGAGAGWGGMASYKPEPLRWPAPARLWDRATTAHTDPTADTHPPPSRLPPPPPPPPAGEDKFRRVRLTNPAIQQRVAAWRGAVDFLQLAGFQRDASGEGLEMPADRVRWRAEGGSGGGLPAGWGWGSDRGLLACLPACLPACTCVPAC